MHDHRVERLGLVAIAAVAVGVPVLLGVATGAWGIPRNDDWAVLRIALDHAETGEIRFVGWTAVTFIGQLWWSWPWTQVLGASIGALQASTVPLAVAALIAAYVAARQLLPPRRALIATAILAAAPAFAAQSTSYMTDTPALAGQLGALAAGLVALRRRRAARWGWVLLALLLGLWGFAVRQVAAAALAGLVLGLAVLLQDRVGPPWRGGRAAWTGWAGWAGLGAAVLAGMVVLQLVRAQVGDTGVEAATGLRLTPGRAAVDLARAWFTLALICAPALVLAWRGSVLRRRPGQITVGVLGVLAIAIGVHDALQPGIRGASPLLVGNFLTRFGSMANLVLSGERAPLYPWPIWTVIAASAAVAGALLGALIVDWLAGRPWGRFWAEGVPVTVRAQQVALLVFGVLAFAGASVHAMVGAATFERYLWPAIFAVAVGLLALSPRAAPSPASPAVQRSSPRRMGATLVVLGVLAGMSLVGTVEEYTFASARWRSGIAWTQAGVPSDAIDAGFEWMGFHHDGVAFDDRLPELIAPPHPGYARMFRGSTNCITVASAPLDHRDVELLEERRYRPLPLWPRRELLVYRNPGLCAARGVEVPVP